MEHCRVFLRLAALILAALACAPAQAATELCAPYAVSGGGAANVSNPGTGVIYTLDGRGCALFSDFDAPYFLTQGYTTPGSGGGGGGGSTLANAAALAAATIPASATRMDVQNVVGTFSPTASNCPLTYFQGTATPTGVVGEVLNVPSGIYWEPDYDTSPVRACQFGMVSDAGWDQVGTGLFTGTDNAPMINAALEFAQRYRYSTVCIDDGNYRTLDALIQGYGESGGVRTLNLVACNGARSGYTLLAGVNILVDKTDRCGVYLQGGRGTVVRGLSFIGKNYVFTNTLTGTTPFPTTDAGWLDPKLLPGGANNPGATGGLQRATPYAAICLGALNGSPPSPPYPSVSYPAWITSGGQYHKAPNSDILIEDVAIFGFAVGVVQSPNSGAPGNGDGNDDFLKMNRLLCSNNVYCISIGGTQSRNVLISNVNGNREHTMITNTLNGAQNGKMGGPITNVSIGLHYQLFKLTGSLGNPITFDQFYSESSIRIGTVAPASSFNSDLSIRGCQFNGGVYNTGVVPDSLIDLTGTGMAATIENCELNGEQRLNVLVRGNGSQALTINGGAWQGGMNLGALFNSTAAQQAANFTGGYFAGSFQQFPGIGMGKLTLLNNIRGSFYSTPTAGIAGQVMSETLTSGSQRVIANQFTTGFIDQLNLLKWMFANQGTGANLNFTTTGQFPVTAPAAPPTFTACDQFSFTYATTPQSNAGQQANQMSLGDVIYHQPTGTLLVVTSIGANNGTNGFPITATQMNNMTVTPATILTFGTLNAGSGYVPGTYNNVPLTGAGTGATANIVVNGTGNVASVTLVLGGKQYISANSVTTANTNLGGSGTGFSIFVATVGYPCLTNTVSDPTLAGNSTLIHTGVVIPTQMWWGDFVNGSPNVSNVGNGSGGATTLSQYFAVNDYFRFFNSLDAGNPMPYPSGVTLTTVTNGSPSGSVVLSANARSTGRFPLFPLPLIGVGLPREVMLPSLVSALPTCNAGNRGLKAFVTDQNTAVAYKGAVTGGGATNQAVQCDGAAWYQN
jgi:hypothetical protein